MIVHESWDLSSMYQDWERDAIFPYKILFSGELDCSFWKTGHIYTEAFLAAILFCPIDQESKERVPT